MNCLCEEKDEFQGIVFCVNCGLEYDDIMYDEEYCTLSRPEKTKKVKPQRVPTVSDLRKQAKELGLKGYSGLKKKELEALIQKTIKIQKENQVEKEKMLVRKNIILTFKNESDDEPPLFEDESDDEPPLFEDESDDEPPLFEDESDDEPPLFEDLSDDSSSGDDY